MTDPHEHGFEAAQRRRLELPPEPLREERKRWQRPVRMGWQAIVIVLGVVVLFAVGKAVSARNATSLKADCTRFQLAVGETSVPSRSSTLLHWAVTAPGGTPYVVAIDRPEGSVSAHEQVTPVRAMDKRCLARGQFGVLVPPGNYNVALYREVQPGNVEERMAFRAVTVTAK